ncbi:prepilin-type N-terminal cleavage/methylation domain-containing protein [Pseudomonas sp. GD03858]|uniref:type IV pilus modification PilV family protein n=1 Tax=unclassified Pseudomonas TaxID=196821 RepID=UPI00244757AA|nr:MULTISPECIES: prepilin-type N-terminal cleavage/methylation domain-containing protein [unclassified Pseudomonas]MDH0646166.1 prepilin-type N-terminal cleavage/methylation domain-containing protein [Pseudomonas sp. GD03867]MDH0661835.1 prepilin-type N-terminal cleavage/methylation domain-containing protein [Pseudomonas sp. GD03858]
MRAREGGMTLLEILLAMTVLALGLFASAALQLRGMQATEGARLSGQALQLAQGMLEQGRAAGSLDAGAQAAWQAQVIRQLGASAQGHLSLSAGMLSVELDWPGTGEQRQALSLQGRVAP